MARDRIYQPTTNTVGDLAIGVMKVSVGTNAIASVTGTAPVTTDTNAAATVTGGVTTLGSLKSATVSMKPTFKEHKTAYPQILDFKIAEMLAANFKAEVEEVGSTNTLALLDKAIDTLETGTPHYLPVEAVSEFANGGTLALFAPYCQLKPTINMNFGDDFSSIPFEFEALVNPTYTNKDLVYRARANATARSLANQAVTQNVNNLGIGMMQVRIGKPARRQATTATLTGANMRVQKTTGITSVGTVTGPYTGAVDGAFILTCTVSAPGGVTFTTTMPNGAAGAVVALTDGTAKLIGQGVSVAFPAAHVAGGTTNFTVGDVYVIGATTAQALDANVTGILSPYSYLTSANSVGAIKSADLQTNPTFKEHFSGFPKVKDLIMLESSTVTVSTALEEISAAAAAVITKGYATTAWDMLFDASVNGSLYYVPVEIVMNLATGGVLSFWLPNCQVTPEADYAPGNDWASMPFKLDSQVQGAGSAVKRIYRQTFVPNI